jgi:hypothetical protein
MHAKNNNVNFIYIIFYCPGSIILLVLRGEQF